ncbi:hypothetical protein [Pseudodesulfovibrio indicus]|uniref:Uncharacterized protein n=1 Tax=Pseudodesulfovibrio indicus TaxID=1716143 RepID=A0A126QQ13_9BACT|nr:hypothetical protein [Pseudodesulfovibrio indicus]AMK11565.1 hypothetical protein AWY79_10790 [Pseudodesulfovibrio indicus]TDT89971.1 hypothetical protein EDC59_103274 [Pseudodesulfovibrio indicus]
MTSISVIFGFALAIFFIVFRMISKHRYETLNALQNEQHELTSKHESLVAQRRELQREIADKETLLASLRSMNIPLPDISIQDLEAGDTDESASYSRYLLNQKKITPDQNQRALQKMEILKMDYLGVCMTLGFIDLETSQQAQRAAKSSATKPR